MDPFAAMAGGMPDNITGGHAGPSSAGEMGHTGDIGPQSLGDYYGRGSRTRQSDAAGLGTVELIALGALAVGALWVIRST